jgi:hypothetical protein
MRLPGPFEAGEEYNEQKVAQLKDALLESLKSATNIRNLKSEDSITLCVFGGATMGQVMRPAIPVRTVPPAGGVTGEGGTVATAAPVNPPAAQPAMSGFFASGRAGGMPARGSILTIRVKKSDVDAFAKGKLDLDQFRKKASMTIYPGGGDGGTTLQRWEAY